MNHLSTASIYIFCMFSQNMSRNAQTNVKKYIGKAISSLINHIYLKKMHFSPSLTDHNMTISFLKYL